MDHVSSVCVADTASFTVPTNLRSHDVMQGVGTAQDIDNGMKLGTNQPMGPLQLADFIGMAQYGPVHTTASSCNLLTIANVSSWL